MLSWNFALKTRRTCNPVAIAARSRVFQALERLCLGEKRSAFIEGSREAVPKVVPVAQAHAASRPRIQKLCLPSREAGE